MNAICQQCRDIRCSSLLTSAQHSLHVRTSTRTKRHSTDHRSLGCFSIRPAVKITRAIVSDNNPCQSTSDQSANHIPYTIHPSPISHILPSTPPPPSLFLTHHPQLAHTPDLLHILRNGEAHPTSSYNHHCDHHSHSTSRNPYSYSHPGDYTAHTQ